MGREVKKVLKGSHLQSFICQCTLSLSYKKQLMAHETQIYSRGVTKGKTGEIEIWTQFFRYSKTLRNMADLADTRFWIGFQKIWDARIYVVRTLRSMKFWDERNLRCTNLCSENLKMHEILRCTILSCRTFFIPPKTCISRPYCKDKEHIFATSMYSTQ